MLHDYLIVVCCICPEDVVTFLGSYEDCRLQQEGFVQRDHGLFQWKSVLHDDRDILVICGGELRGPMKLDVIEFLVFLV